MTKESKTYKRDRVMTKCNWAIQSLQEALSYFISGNEEEAQKENDERWGTRFWRGSLELEKAQSRLTETIAELSNVNGEVSDDISMWGEYFHTALRKYFDNTSSTVLHRTINLYPNQWLNLLINVSNQKGGEGAIWNVTSAGVYTYINHNLEDCFELKAAFHYFILENDDCARTPFKELLGVEDEV